MQKYILCESDEEFRKTISEHRAVLRTGIRNGDVMFYSVQEAGLIIINLLNCNQRENLIYRITGELS